MNPQFVSSPDGRFARLRPRGKVAGWLSLAACLALLATSIVLGTGAAGAKVTLADLGNWLPSSRANTIVHVNGTTGQVDGRVELAGEGQGPIQVGTDGNAVLVLDQGTGTVSRIDPAQLAVPQTRDYGANGMSLAVGGGQAWLVDHPGGTVQPIDPMSLVPVGGAIDLRSRPLGPSGTDASGRLWVTLPATGQIVAIRGAVPAAPVQVAEPGHVLQLTIADGKPVVTDTTAGVVKVIGPDGPVRTINLPEAVAKAKADAVRVPERSEGPLLPVLASDSGQLVLLDVNDGAVQAAPMATGGDDYGPPEVLGNRVYVPDRSNGTLVVYDTAAAAFAPSVRVTGSAGPLDLDVRDGLLWANDQTQAVAVVIDAKGDVHPVDKYKPGAPSDGDKSPRPTSTPTATPTRTPSGPGTSAPTNSTSAPASSAPPASTGPPQRTEPPGRTEPPNGGLPTVPQVPPVVVTITQHVTVAPSPNPPATTVPEPPRVPPQEPPTTKAPAPPAPTSRPPAATTKPAPAPPPTGKPATSKPATSNPAPPPPTTPAPQPQPPGTPKAESGPGRITLVFAASPGARPDRYSVNNLPAGAKATPATVAPGGPFQFVVTGLSCANEYSFTVAAEFGQTKLASAPSTAVRPCVLVSAPTALSTEVPRNGHGFTASWKAPANAGGSTVSYKVAWSGGGTNGSTTTTGTSATASGLAN
ncbi:MAG: hypothetical protein HOV94_04685, partial [Saccharothrix sp.]|nr:hypothetical protein [Saccharothrix sp.]